VTCTPKNWGALEGIEVRERREMEEMEEMVTVGWLKPLRGEEMQQSHSRDILIVWGWS